MRNVTLAFIILAMTLFNKETAMAQNAKLIVYRKGCIYGAFAKYPVILDGKKIGKLKNNAIIDKSVVVGKHTVMPRQHKRAVTFDAQGGEDYVLVYKTRIGILGGRPKLKIMTVAMAKKDYKYFRKHAGSMTM